MRPARSLLAGVAAAALACPAALRAQDLDALFTRTDALAGQGDYAGARSALQAGIQDPAGRNAVLARYGDVRDRLAEWSFREKHPLLRPAEMFAGTVEKWREKQRGIDLAWKWEALGVEQRLADFVPWKDDWLFRVPVGSAFSIELQGAWPAALQPVSFVVGVDAARTSGWRITPGFHRTKVKPELKMPRRAERFGDPREVLEASSEGLEEPGAGYSYSLEVKNGQFTLRSGSKKLAAYKTQHADLVPGWIGFCAPGLTAVRISGDLEKSAWEARQAARRLQLLDHYRLREYDLLADMPPWFAAAVAASAADTEFRPPPDAPEASKAAWAQLQHPPDGFDLAAWSTSAGLNEAQRAYAEALHAAGRGAWKECEAKATQALNGGLKFGPVMALRARGQFYSSHGEGMLRELAANIADWPIDCGHELARLRGRAYGPKGMLQALDQAIAAGALSPRVLTTRDRLAAALAGPAGQDSFRYDDAPNKVLVLSEGTKGEAEAVARAAFNSREMAVKVVPGVFTAKEAMTILHFTSDGSRAAFCARLGLDEQTDGYLPELRVSLFAGDPGKALEREKLNMAVWLHHLDGTLDIATAPEWFVYGNRAFFAAAEFEKGRLDYYTNMAMARRAKEVPAGLRFKPAELMLMSPAQWQAKKDQAEAESWILVHFFHRNEIPPYQGRMARYFHTLASGQDRQAAYTQAFGDLPEEQLNSAVALHRKAQVEKVE
ncbi:MAG: hypothetical protein EYC70_04995 [Planctomycetota bacterium]|nr:MAG: hypothetical protein EYC70_04995 [Planctomycetota bacterium]